MFVKHVRRKLKDLNARTCFMRRVKMVATAEVGAYVGRALGRSVGVIVGRADGSFVGCIVGSDEGTHVGSGVGL